MRSGARWALAGSLAATVVTACGTSDNKKSRPGDAGTEPDASGGAGTTDGAAGGSGGGTGGAPDSSAGGSGGMVAGDAGDTSDGSSSADASMDGGADASIDASVDVAPDQEAGPLCPPIPLDGGVDAGDGGDGGDAGPTELLQWYDDAGTCLACPVTTADCDAMDSRLSIDGNELVLDVPVADGVLVQAWVHWTYSTGSFSYSHELYPGTIEGSTVRVPLPPATEADGGPSPYRNEIVVWVLDICGNWVFSTTGGLPEYDEGGRDLKVTLDLDADGGPTTDPYCENEYAWEPGPPQ